MRRYGSGGGGDAAAGAGDHCDSEVWSGGRFMTCDLLLSPFCFAFLFRSFRCRLHLLFFGSCFVLFFFFFFAEFKRLYIIFL